MDISGKIKELHPEKQVTASFRKRECVITTQEQYPQHILVEFVQDKCELLNTVQVGQDVKISINLRGREWTAPDGQVKYFNSIHGWRIEPLQPAAPATAGSAQTQTDGPPSNLPPLDGPTESSDDDLPF
jgi:hypothetical protein